MRDNGRRAGGAMERLGAGSGVLWFLLIMVGNQMSSAGTSDSLRPSGEQILADLRRSSESTTATAGFTMELLGFAALLVFLGYLFWVLRRGERSGDFIADILSVPQCSADPRGPVGLRSVRGSRTVTESRRDRSCRSPATGHARV